MRGRGCAGLVALVIGVPHLLMGTGVVLGTGSPIGLVFVGSGTVLCLVAGRAFGADWRATLGAVIGVMIAATAVAFAVSKPT